MWAIGFLVTWQTMFCFGLQDLLDARRALLLDVLGVVLHVTAVEHRVLGCADVDERRLHAGQDVLHLAEVHVAVDLRHVVGGSRHVVLDQIAAFEHGHLRGPLPHADDHQIAADRTTLAVAAAPLLELLVVELEGIAPEDRLHRLHRRRRTAAAVPASTRTAGASTAAATSTSAAAGLGLGLGWLGCFGFGGRRRPGVSDLGLAHERAIGSLG